ncbi:MAG TPA: L,D-transpeptidase [Gemmatimonadales bacterium]|nr:L,D-transpeptidase [Gemmatimonadales bacterium]
MPNALGGLAPLWLWATLAIGVARTPAIRINLPAHRLELIDSGRVIHSYRIAIGDTTYPTPTGRFWVRRIVWDPAWIPPVKEPWARDRKPEAPGPDNPMGPVKLPLGGGYYIHGTPRSIARRRPPTHGCIRLRSPDAIELARYLEAATLAAGSADSAGIRDTAGERTVRLPTVVRVDVRYDLLELRRGRIIANPDPYLRRTAASDSAGARLLAAAGFPADSALAFVSRLLDSARVGAVSAPLRR